MFYQRNIEREKIAYKSIVEMAPCQVHPVIIHTSSSAVSARTAPVRPTGSVRRNLFGQPDQREMVRTFDNENARQRKRLDNYKIIEPIAQSKEININKETEPSNESFPGLIAKELEAHEKETQKQKLKQKSSGEASSSSSLTSSSSLSQRQEQIEMTPTLSTKAKLRTLHTNSRGNCDAANEDTRYRPYIKQTLITDVMPKRKSIPPP
ncbi:uncharacterized protein LOC118737748 [Rhagoletis pomonella]|uniref:uncharacterized protein LOC118737748 n=1 Tax=Rhagoletis pomonella TaxID=28610 RepID=UPI00177C535E|nr:uncharacterized protein LOC118737748 [Rhagoletis pomonella]